MKTYTAVLRLRLTRRARSPQHCSRELRAAFAPLAVEIVDLAPRHPSVHRQRDDFDHDLLPDPLPTLKELGLT